MSYDESNRTLIDRDWYHFKESNDTTLFRQILEEQGLETTLQSAIEYLLESESRYSSVLSDYKVKHKKLQDKKHLKLEQYSYSLRSLGNEICYAREKEQEMIKICLSRLYKNNIMLIGEPGVGKTFLIGAVAHSLNIDIYCVDISSILSGSKYRGEFEKKFHAVLDEALRHKKVLFFDEAHTILNTGNSDGGISGADILKPYLTNSSLQIIGATTTEESGIFFHDKAFARRFNFIQLEELSLDQTKNIIKNKFKETLHWEQEVFDQVFSYLDAKFTTRRYPDKAIDFFDFYFSGEKLSFFNFADMDKAFKLFTQMSAATV